MRTKAVVLTALAAGLATTAAACSSSSATKSAPPTSFSVSSTTAPSAPQGSGPVDVLYAGSLQDVMNNDVAKPFQQATGYNFVGTSGDSGTLASEIKAKTTVGDVFISANPSKDQALEGAANGNWVSWYASFATSPLVLAYNPHSSYLHDFTSEPWYRAINQSGLLLGRTDPTTDPAGQLAAEALNDAAASQNEPALASDATNSSEVFPETTTVSRLQSGQLDAAFMYSVQATAAGLPFITVSGMGVPALQAEYTITVLAHAPDADGADAFVGWLLGYDGQAVLTKAGIDLTKPVSVSGNAPSSLQGVLAGG